MGWTRRSRVRAILDHKEADCIPMKDAFWIPTVHRWETEGLAPGTNLQDYFGFDLAYLYIDSSMRFPERLIEETMNT